LGNRHDRIDEITSQYPTCAISSFTPISSSRLLGVDDNDNDNDDVNNHPNDSNDSRTNSARHRPGSRTGSFVTPRSRRISPVPSPTGSPRSSSSRTKQVSESTAVGGNVSTSNDDASMRLLHGHYPPPTTSNNINNNNMMTIPSTVLSALAESNRHRSSFDHINNSEKSAALSVVGTPTTPPKNHIGRGSLDRLPPIVSPHTTIATATIVTNITNTTSQQPP